MKRDFLTSTCIIILSFSLSSMNLTERSNDQSDFLRKIYSNYNAAQFERLLVKDKLIAVLEYGEYLISNKKGGTDLYWMGNSFAEVSKFDNTVAFFNTEERLKGYTTKNKPYMERLIKVGFDIDSISNAKSR